MSLHQLEAIAGFLSRAVCPEDVFGALDGGKSKEASLKAEFRKLAKAVHPDAHAGDVAATGLSQTLFQQLEEFHNVAQQRLKKNEYGSRAPLPHKIPLVVKSKYVRESALVAGDICDLHVASLESGRRNSNLLLKIVRRTADNDFLRAEKNTLDAIHAHVRFEKSPLADSIPHVKDSFILSDKRVSVMDRFEGFLDGVNIHQRFKIGVDGRTVSWMWKRITTLLSWIHGIGYLHGAVLPPHVMFYPDNDGTANPRDPRKHTVRLVDWCYSIDMANRTRLSAWVPTYKDFYAPEILEKKKLGPYTDLYMAAKTMIYLMGGDPSKDGFPDAIPAELVRVISKCLHKTPAKRPQDAGLYFEEVREAINKAYGARRWHEFVVPGI